ncbi:hypothetical protein OCL06_15960 [Alteromonas sp. ASW11-19]|uniref:Uncharacterized protein n=1 Tax=Alteromonas salexigens TaxID=2982530 RepID=A0ABT2VRY9_9ALTE|nr:hypothetical protein [Alteromonas salexigens]MCU7556087.1 hypothetical protein [Alteromonas salexigens]
MSTALLKQSVFNVWGNKAASHHLCVEVKGLGMVHINRTCEGVIVDVYDKSDNDGCLGSLAFTDGDFHESFADKVHVAIESYDPSADVCPSFIEQAYQHESSVDQAVADWFKAHPVSLDALTPLKGECKPFSDQVRELTRPYLSISKQHYNQLEQAQADFYQTPGGRVVTFGEADGGYALMPLQEEAAKDILAGQSVLSAIFHAGEVSDVQRAQLHKLGWIEWQDSGDYSDFELEASFGEAQDDRYHSLNVHLTFNWQHSQMYLVIGTNLGDGFNGYHQIYHDGLPLDEQLERSMDTLRESTTDDPVITVIDQHPHAWASIKEGVGRLSSMLGISAN